MEQGTTLDAAAPPALFHNLLASRPAREKRAMAGAAAVAVLLHAGLIAALARGEAGAGPPTVPVTEEIVLLDIVEELPALPELERPRTDAAAPGPPARKEEEKPRRVEAPAHAAEKAGTRGFRTLPPPPPVVPPDLPPPPSQIHLDEADFSGLGLEDEPGGGGAAAGAAGGAPRTADEIAAAPVFVPRDVEPELTNRDAVARALRRRYPLYLQDAGIGGTVLVWLLIDEEGKVRKYEIKRSSGRKALDRAAIAVIDMMEFSPARNRGHPVAVWVSLPITFRVE